MLEAQAAKMGKAVMWERSKSVIDTSAPCGTPCNQTDHKGTGGTEEVWSLEGAHGKLLKEGNSRDKLSSMIKGSAEKSKRRMKEAGAVGTEGSTHEGRKPIPCCVRGNHWECSMGECEEGEERDETVRHHPSGCGKPCEGLEVEV